jgi:hypothetical protein
MPDSSQLADWSGIASWYDRLLSSGSAPHEQRHGSDAQGNCKLGGSSRQPQT